MKNSPALPIDNLPGSGEAAFDSAAGFGADSRVASTDGCPPTGPLDKPAIERQKRLDESLLKAAEQGEAGKIARFLAEGANPAAQKENKGTALHAAARDCNFACVEILAAVAPPDQATESGETPLMFSLMTASDEARRCSELLLQKGANPRLADSDGWTALHWAAVNDNAAMVRALLPLCDPDAKNNGGESALFCALNALAMPCARLLLPVSDVAATEAHGRSALSAMVRAGSSSASDEERAAALRETHPFFAGKEEARDHFGMAPIHYAAWAGLAECAKFLAPLSPGALGERNGRHPLDLALETEKWACADALAPWVPMERTLEALGSAPPGALPRHAARKEAAELQAEIERAGRKGREEGIDDVSGAPAEDAEKTPSEPRGGRRL